MSHPDNLASHRVKLLFQCVLPDPVKPTKPCHVQCLCQDQCYVQCVQHEWGMELLLLLTRKGEGAKEYVQFTNQTFTNNPVQFPFSQVQFSCCISWSILIVFVSRLMFVFVCGCGLVFLGPDRPRQPECWHLGCDIPATTTKSNQLPTHSICHNLPKWICVITVLRICVATVFCISAAVLNVSGAVGREQHGRPPGRSLGDGTPFPPPSSSSLFTPPPNNVTQ